MTPQKFLAAVELNDDPSAVLHAAMAMAAPLDARVIVLSVTQPYQSGAAIPKAFTNAAYDLAVMREKLQPQIDRFRLMNVFARSPEPDLHQVAGDPAEQIVRMAAHFDVDVVLVGSHERSALRRLFVGSIAASVVRKAGCPVMVVREKNHNPEWIASEVETTCGDCRTVRLDGFDDTLLCARHLDPTLHSHSWTYSLEAQDRVVVRGTH